MTLQMLVAGRSEAHTRRENQDRLYPRADQLPRLQSQPAVVAVADGMGGAQDGALAATWAVEPLALLASPQTFNAYIEDSCKRLGWSLPSLPKLPTTAQHILVHFQFINRRIIEHSGTPEMMGTTLSLAVLNDDQLWLGHLGDTRISLWRDNALQRLTQDHSQYSALLAEGTPLFHVSDLDLSPADLEYAAKHNMLEEAFFYLPDPEERLPQHSAAIRGYLSSCLHGELEQTHRFGQLLRVSQTQRRLEHALGKNPQLRPEQIFAHSAYEARLVLQAQDLLLLSSDGLHDVLSEQAISKRLEQIQARLDPEEADRSLLSWGCDLLFQDACDAGADDNISLLLVQMLPNSERYTTSSADFLAAIQNADEDEISMMGHMVSSHTLANLAFDPTIGRPSDSSKTGLNTAREWDAQSDKAFSQEGSESPRPLTLGRPHTPRHQKAPRALAAQHLPLHQPVSLRQPEDDSLPSPSLVAHEPPPSLPSTRSRPWPQSAKEWAYMGIILFLFGAWFFASTPPTPPLQSMQRHTKTKQPLPRGVSSGNKLPLLQLQLIPSRTFTTPLQWRLAHLHQLGLLYAQYTTLWQRDERVLAPLQQSLMNPALSLPALMTLQQQVPLETSSFQQIDTALQHATITLLEAWAPNYKDNLQQMVAPPALPPGQPLHSASPQWWQRYRKRVFQQWEGRIRTTNWKDWRIHLLFERIAIHPISPKTPPAANTQAMQRCIPYLKRALKQAPPTHPIYTELESRLQLHQRQGKN